MPIGTIIGIIFGVILGIIFLVLLIMSIKIVPQSYFYVVERLGTYWKTWENGLHFLIPFVDRIVKKDNFKEKVLDFIPQDVITRDNAIIKVDTVVFIKVRDPKLYTYGAENPFIAIEKLTATSLRNLLGELELDDSLTSRETINKKLAVILDDATDPWGIKVFRVELKNILPSNDVQMAMEKQLRAEREKRANILDAEGLKSASILEAEGKKLAAILEAEGIRQSSILKAEGEKKSIELVKSAKLDENILTLKAIEAIPYLANGRATKIIVSPDLQNLARAMGTAEGIFKNSNNIDKIISNTKNESNY